MTAVDVSNEIIKMEEGERIRYAVADPAIFIRNGGPSIAENMAKCRWRRADNKRLPGWEQVRQRLQGENGIPMMYFADNCEDTLRTLPTLQHDDDDVEDLDTDGEDHAADEIRYACMSRPWKAKLIVPKQGLQMPLLPSQMTFDQLVAKNRRARLTKELIYG
jgi:hypothetical protein